MDLIKDIVHKITIVSNIQAFIVIIIKVKDSQQTATDCTSMCEGIVSNPVQFLICTFYILLTAYSFYDSSPNIIVIHVYIF